jgi:cardiolipin synthase (CMP-forming)
LDRRDWLTVPNALTLLRLLLVPVFVALHLWGRPGWALACFCTAAVSDGLDGLLARALNQRSKLGALLDPIADKLLAFAALCTLVAERRLPLWLLGLIIFRDGWMIFGALTLKHKNLEIPTAPTRIGKYATFSLTVLVVLALADQAVARSALLHAYMVVVGFTAGLCVAVSTLQYFVRFGHLLFAPARRLSSDK